MFIRFVVVDFDIFFIIREFFQVFNKMQFGKVGGQFGILFEMFVYGGVDFYYVLYQLLLDMWEM